MFLIFHVNFFTFGTKILRQVFEKNKARILLRFSKYGNTILPCICNIMVQTSDHKLVTLTDAFVVYLFLTANVGILTQIRSRSLASSFFLFIIHSHLIIPAEHDQVNHKHINK